ncbi:universal stress protein [Arthrobacter echini]|uniref:Universal stress protein n=1 Tax=Arthrobacter echini TaxID=1529066 RepID=A0A4S5E023_9MICC|nr:universal stress protein [Arthrobacter echini]THJ64627.1 universal stress protein [Arthrobacter echini]
MATTPDPGTEQPVAGPEEPMLVAVRDPDGDRAVVDWAAARAASLSAPVTVLHAVADPGLLPPGSSFADEVKRGRELIGREASRVVGEHPDLRVGTYLHCGGIVEALLGLAATAPMLVLGADRKDAASGEFKGSVALQVALNSSAPVVVVPPTDHAAAGSKPGGVVVGVDGSGMSRSALLRAAEEAARTGTTLTVVTTVGAAAEASLAEPEMLAGVRAQFPGLEVRWTVDDVNGPVRALSLQAAGAALLVIGRHGSGARSAMSLGSVTHKLLLDPPCPTLVITRTSVPAEA